MLFFLAVHNNCRELLLETTAKVKGKFTDKD